MLELELVDYLEVVMVHPDTSMEIYIDFITIETLGNAQDFGDLINGRHRNVWFHAVQLVGLLLVEELHNASE